ncbi:phosphate ABC transporter substrate-binding protein [bacterium]|nr:phosphate ABC transporter substrate-binding protein [bacterium]
MKKILFVISLVLSGCSLFNASASKVSRTIHIQGSDTMVLLTTSWAEEYMKKNSSISVYAEGGGSAVGIKALIEGKVDICASSRPLQASEVRKIAEKYGSISVSFLVAKDALSVYLNPNNPIRDLTFEQVKGIFTGKIKNWKEVGGQDQSIHVIIRSPNSGTYLYFKEHVLNEEGYSELAQVLPTTSAIINEVLVDNNAIGYGGLAYGKDQVIHCRINGIEATEKNVRNDQYPIIRYLYLYTRQRPQNDVKSFIDWILTAEGQDIVKKSGYIPLLIR